MNLQIRDQTVDLVVVGVANLMNIIMVFVFILRTRRIQHPLIVGIAWGAFILVLFAAVYLNIKAKRAWWYIVLPLLLALFLLLELALDYVFKIQFRSTWLLGPYLLIYYAAIMGMIGYAFLTEKKYGFITLGTYFLSQIAALYSYLNVGHG